MWKWNSEKNRFEVIIDDSIIDFAVEGAYNSLGGYDCYKSGYYNEFDDEDIVIKVNDFLQKTFELSLRDALGKIRNQIQVTVEEQEDLYREILDDSYKPVRKSVGKMYESLSTKNKKQVVRFMETLTLDIDGHYYDVGEEEYEANELDYGVLSDKAYQPTREQQEIIDEINAIRLQDPEADEMDLVRFVSPQEVYDKYMSDDDKVEGWGYNELRDPEMICLADWVEIVFIKRSNQDEINGRLKNILLAETDVVGDDEEIMYRPGGTYMKWKIKR